MEIIMVVRLNIMLRVFLLSSAIVSISACSNDSLVGNSCNGSKIEKDKTRSSECYIPREAWIQEDIPFNEMVIYLESLNKTFTTLEEQSEQGIGIFRNMSEEEKLSKIKSFKNQILEFNNKKWARFLSFRKKGDKIYRFPSEHKTWRIGSGYIIVRNGKVIAIFHTVYE